MRTSFPTVHNEPVQLIQAAREFDLPVIDLIALAPAYHETEAQRLAHEAANRPFDLKAGPVLRANLLRLEPAEHVLLLTFHHIVSDGWSTVLFWRELGALLPSCCRGASFALGRIADSVRGLFGLAAAMASR